METPPSEPPSVNEEQTLMMGAGNGEETRFDLAPPGPIPGVEAGDPPTMPKVDGAPPASPSSSSGFPNVTEVESQSSDVGRPSKPSVRISDSRPGVPGSGSPYRPPSSSAPASSAGNSTRLSTKGKTPPQLKGYTLTDRLGAGTFGSVWRARHLRTNAEMAVKLFDQSIGADWDYLKREIETLLTVGKHPNIVTLHDADFFQEPPFYAMELMHTSMDAALRAHRKAVLANVESGEMEDHQWIPWPDLDQAAKWFEQMASGLGYVHGKAFIHCDMKPANVLLDDGDNARIVDFGQALLKGRDNVSLGTLFFMPPEQTEIEDKGLGDGYSFGFPMYAVGQCADILAFRPVYVPVGEDQVAHIEMCREVARRFDLWYCGVDDHTEDADFVEAGGVFPIPEAMVGRVARLVGTDGKQKMSKSLNNAIFLSDTPKQVKKKINAMYPGQSRNPDEPGDPEINPVFEFADVFVKDTDLVADLRARYRKGDNLGDGHVKAYVIDAVNELLAPIRERRAEYEKPGGDDLVIDIIRTGTARANVVAEETLDRAKAAMGLRFFGRTLGVRD